MYSYNGMGLLTENLHNILNDRDKEKMFLLPKNEFETVKEGIRFSYIDGKINKDKLDYYSKNYGIDGRYKIQIVVSNERDNYYYIKGIIKYKNKCYKFYVMESHINVVEIKIFLPCEIKKFKRIK